MRLVNRGTFAYTALQLWPQFAGEADNSRAWTFEREEGYDIQLAQRQDGAYRWLISFKVDGVDTTVTINPRYVLAVSVGPAVDGNSSRNQSRTS